MNPLKSGATVLVLNAMTIPDSHYAFVSPTESRTWDEFRRVMEMLSEMPVCRGFKANKNDQTVTFSNGSKIKFLVAAYSDRLRGCAFHGVVLEDLHSKHTDFVNQIIRPALRPVDGFCVRTRRNH